MAVYNLYFDGSCEPNPKGFVSIGVHVPELDINHSEALGEGEGMTNQVAEWSGVKKGLELIETEVNEGDEVRIFGDSEMVIKQLKGDWKVKAKNLLPIYINSMDIARKLKSKGVAFHFEFIPRDENRVADDLSHIPLVKHCEENGFEMCECGGILVPRQGRSGKFLGCTHYPKCRNTKTL